jgi:hypothetical protein
MRKWKTINPYLWLINCQQDFSMNVTPNKIELGLFQIICLNLEKFEQGSHLSTQNNIIIHIITSKRYLKKIHPLIKSKNIKHALDRSMLAMPKIYWTLNTFTTVTSKRYDTFTTSIQFQQLFLKLKIGYVRFTCRKSDPANSSCTLPWWKLDVHQGDVQITHLKQI